MSGANKQLLMFLSYELASFRGDTMHPAITHFNTNAIITISSFMIFFYNCY